MNQRIPPNRRRLGALLVATLALCAGCATLHTDRGRPLVPWEFLTQVGPFQIWTNDPLPADHSAVRELVSLQRQLQTNLALSNPPEQQPIEVCILDNASDYQRFLTYHYPQLPLRRAFFLARGDRRVIYTYRGNRLAEDLRHEATHALLHTSTANLPLWLDEGLAEYFEVPEQSMGMNLEHLTRLPVDLQQGWTPDLARLESLTDVREMSPRDYREAWLWVHYALHGPPPASAQLLSYLADLKSGKSPERLSERLPQGDNVPTPAILAHLDRIRHEPLVLASPSPANVLVRSQNPAGPETITQSAGPITLTRPIAITRGGTTLASPNSRSIAQKVFDTILPWRWSW